MNEESKVTFNGKEILNDQKKLKDLQMRCFYTSLVMPFYEFQIPNGKKKTPQSVVQYFLTNSLKRPNEVQKFVLETCKGIEGHKTMLDQFVADSGIFDSDLVKRVELGWYLRENGSRWISI